MAFQQLSQNPEHYRWMKRFGCWGFCFFLLKGLLWLVLPLIAYLELTL